MLTRRLYEMLTGRHTFHAETVTETLAAIVMREPDLNALPTNLHPKIEELIRRCLAKNRKERWYAVADVRFEIEAITSDPHGLSLSANRDRARRPLWQSALTGSCCRHSRVACRVRMGACGVSFSGPCGRVR